MPDQPTAVSLKEYFERQIYWLDRHVAIQIKGIDDSKEKALQQLEERLKGMNEFRDALKDQAGRLMTRTESEARSLQIEERLKSIELSRAEGEGKLLMISAFVAFAASVVVVVIANWFFKS